MWVEWMGGTGRLLKTYHNIIVFKLKWLGLDAFWTESFAIYESAV
jgi:hypothetical protein